MYLLESIFCKNRLINFENIFKIYVRMKNTDNESCNDFKLSSYLKMRIYKVRMRIGNKLEDADRTFKWRIIILKQLKYQNGH